MRTAFIVVLALVLGAVLLSRRGPIRGGVPASFPQDRRAAWRDVFHAWVTLALLVGFLELAWVLLERHILGELVFWSLADPWLTPAAYLVIFGVPAVGLLLAAALKPSLVPVSLLGLVFGVLFFESLLLQFPNIHHWAQAVLALGIGLRAAQWVGKNPDRFRRFNRRAWKPLVALTILLAVLTTGTARLRESRALAQIPQGQADAPNILLLILDTVRAASLSAYGYERPTTPVLERIASEGVLFEWPIAPAPWTLPSHVAMMTGRFHYEASAGFLRPLDDTFPTVAEGLEGQGYASVGIVANRYYCSRETGLARGFHHFEDYLGLGEHLVDHAMLGQTVAVQGIAKAESVRALLRALPRSSPRVPRTRHAVRRNAEEINTAFLDWVDDRTPERFFGFLNYYDAHLPYEAPADFQARFAEGARNEPTGDYDASIAYIDQQIGVLLDELDDRGLLENTLIVVSSDHGEHLRDHGLSAHGNSLYSQLVRVPLVMRLPGRLPEGVRVPEPVSLADLPRTFLQLAGADVEDFPGQSLARGWGEPAVGSPSPRIAEWTGGEGPPSRNLSAENDDQLKSILEDGFHYIHRVRDREEIEELYAIEPDPEMEEDLMGSPEGGRTAAELRARLLELLGAGG